MIKQTEFCAGFIQATSYRAESVDELIDGEFDLGVIVSSWDKRATSLTMATNIDVRHWIHLSFIRKDSYGLQDAHHREILQFLGNNLERTTSCVVDSLDIDSAWTELWARIRSVCVTIGRPLRLLFDLSVCPRYLALASFATLVGNGLLDTVTFHYAEGAYPIGGRRELLFTGGRWNPVGVQGLCNVVMPDRKRLYVVSVGFEGDMTLRTVTRSDPDRVSLLFPDPGTRTEYVQVARDANSELIQSYLIPEAEIARAAAGDAVQAWKSLSEKAFERPDENVSYLCCGTKPHALALSLRCLSRGDGTVLYNRPEDHLVVEAVPSGVFWRFDCRDVACLS